MGPKRIIFIFGPLGLYRTCMASLAENVIMWGAEIYDKYKASLPKVD